MSTRSRRPAAAPRRAARPSRPARGPSPEPSVPVVDTPEEWEGEEFVARIVHAAGGGDPDSVEIFADDRGADAALAHTPLYAIVGRPNVGKSRLFNRMTGTRFAIVEDMPGVTRDRQYGDGEWEGRRFQVVDTGGFEPESEDVLLSQMREQARLAVAEADSIVFVLDAQSGLLPADRDIAMLLRSAKKPVFVAVNKVDGPRHDALVADFWEIGFEHLYAVSAEHGRNFDELMDDLCAEAPKVDERPADDSLVRVAVLGRPNAGKSTLVNRLLGEDRLLTSDIPGTTRDSINTWLVRDGQRYLFIDTAGIRRRRSIDLTVEKYAVVQSFKAIDRADVVLYVIDATAGITTQDQRLVGLVAEKGRALVLVLNKWDAVEKDHRTADAYIRHVREELKFATYAPIVTISALTGQRSHRLFPMIEAAHAQFIRRITTSELNGVVREALIRNPPKSWGNQRLKLYYASQVATRPPTFLFAVNNPDLVHFSYRRYLTNMLRAAFAFEGTPLKMFFRGRKKGDSDEEMT
jgi:GTP-binding protein